MNFPGLKKGDILENITIEKLVFGGKGFARLSHPNPELDGRVIFITGNPIPGAVVNLRVLKKKRGFIEGQIMETVQKSPIETENTENKYGMSGGWKWINIPYEEQLKIKQSQVQEALHKIHIPEEAFLPIEPSPTIMGYRNKVEFSYGKYISKKNDIYKHFQVGFHKQGEFSKIEDFEGCPLIDEEQNKIYREMKNYTKTLGLPVYDQIQQSGFFRHIMIRKAHFTEEIMILFSYNPAYLEQENEKQSFYQEQFEKLKTFLIELPKKYSNIASIYLSHNVNKSDTCIGDLELISGKETITETLLGLNFQISPTSFFQTNSSGAEKLYSLVLSMSNQKDGTVLDLYGGTGTIGMIFSKNGAQKVYSVELMTSSSKDGEKNAKKNGLKNVDFINKKVEDFLEDCKDENSELTLKADTIIIDPPRNGMHPSAPDNILLFDVPQIIYVSCNPATLARDLEYILENSEYKIEKIQAMDMFPHTSHIETIVSLVK